MFEPLQDIFANHGVWILQVFLIVTATVTVHQVLRLLLKRLGKRVESTSTEWDDALFYAANKPLGWATWIVGLSWAGEVIYAATSFNQDTQEQIFRHVGKIREAAIVIVLAWFAIRMIASFERIVSSARTDDKYQRWDIATANAVGKVLRASVTITAVLVSLQVFEVPIHGVLAFGGIGGIAVGFAARDLLANFFGALMLFIDKPFTVGDWIRSPDQEIEGTVEEIRWRMTVIRTFDQRPLYVPNATFTSLSVENPSRMRNRRIYETFGVRYEDFGSVKAIVDEIREMLRSHPAIDLNRTLMVNVVEFRESAVEFFVYTFTKTTVWTEFHEIKEDVLLRIGEIVHKYGADFAYPTRTLHIPSRIDPEPEQQ